MRNNRAEEQARVLSYVQVGINIILNTYGRYRYGTDTWQQFSFLVSVVLVRSVYYLLLTTLIFAVIIIGTSICSCNLKYKFVEILSEQK